MKDQVSETLPLGHFDAVWLRNCTATLTSHALKVFAAILKAACRTIGSCCKNQEDWEKLRRPKVSQSHSMPWCHVLHNEVGGFLIATPAYLDDGHVIPCDLEAVWVEGPRSVSRPGRSVAFLGPQRNRASVRFLFFFRTQVWFA